MAATNLQNRLDYIIKDRGCDPFYHAPGDDQCVYDLIDRGSGTEILEWTPPDDQPQYGLQPTEQEIEAVTDAQCEEAEQDLQAYMGENNLTTKDHAMLQAVAAATSVDADDLIADVIQRLADA
tara:strand:- start:20 stop:388 length:369 start_codon:yes stop_codon:yes gene_type:complete